MDILFLSHCGPNPPNKGEKVRAFHEISELSRSHRVHLVAFSRFESESLETYRLRDRCESVYVETRGFNEGLVRAGLGFALGRCLNLCFYDSRRMRAYIRELCSQVKMAAVVAFSIPMVPYAPHGLPLILDMVDVDSFKWEDYSRRRRPRVLYSLEAARLRRYEAQFATAADATLLASKQEVDQLKRVAPASNARCMENGVDFDYFDPAAATAPPELKLRRFVAFVGTMDYFPNVEAATWFTNNVFPELRKSDPSLEFFIVGNNPSRTVRELGRQPGVVVTGGVPDVRPYIFSAQWVVAPLHVARGIQNKVLEALAMGKKVFATTQVCLTFGDSLPEGLVPCDTVQEYLACIQQHAGQPGNPNPDIRRSLRARFDWSRNLHDLISVVDGLTQSPAVTKMDLP